MQNVIDPLDADKNYEYEDIDNLINNIKLKKYIKNPIYIQNILHTLRGIIFSYEDKYNEIIVVGDFALWLYSLKYEILYKRLQKNKFTVDKYEVFVKGCKESLETDDSKESKESKEQFYRVDLNDSNPDNAISKRLKFDIYNFECYNNSLLQSNTFKNIHKLMHYSDIYTKVFEEEVIKIYGIRVVPFGYLEYMCNEKNKKVVENLLNIIKITDSDFTSKKDCCILM